jgi:Carboxypeptidase regulatory-like domain
MKRAWISVRGCRGIFFFTWVSLVAFGMCLSPIGARAQGTSTASVTGTVLDSSGAVVPAAEVVITQIDTGFSQSTKSGADGSFSFPVLPVGNYRLDVTKDGFNSYQQTGIVLTVSQAAQFSISLQVGAVQQRIVVSAAPSPINTTTGELSGLVDQQQLVDLPLNGRNPAGLVLLAAGVSNPAMNSGTTGPGPGVALQFSYPAGIGGSIEQQGALIPAVNGIRSGGVYFSLDGANNVDAYSVSGGPFPNPDAV